MFFRWARLFLKRKAKYLFGGALVPAGLGPDWAGPTPQPPHDCQGKTLELAEEQPSSRRPSAPV